MTLIRYRIKQAQDHQKSYANKRKRDLEFDVSDMIFVRVSLYCHVMRFGQKGKLALRFIGPFKTFERIGKVVY